jgi:ketosteroid isomerase-like protein
MEDSGDFPAPISTLGRLHCQPARTGFPPMKTSIQHDTDVAEIASRLAEYCRRGDFVGAQKALFAPDAVSVEPEGATHGQITKGLAAIAKKSESFAKAFEVHSSTVSEAIVAGDFFACSMAFDVTDRSSGARMPLNEICVYEVKGGRVVREQFFYEPQD